MDHEYDNADDSAHWAAAEKAKKALKEPVTYKGIEIEWIPPFNSERLGNVVDLDCNSEVEPDG